MSHSHGLRVVVADHQLPVRQELKRLLHSEPGVSVVAQCATADAAVRLAGQHRPDVLLLDLNMPDRGGFTALRALASGPQPVRTLALTAPVGKSLMLEALSLGARGVLQKGSPKPLIVESIRTVARDDYWVAPGQLGFIVEALRTYHPVIEPPSAAQRPEIRERYHLTPRELEIVAGITTGESNKEIAERLAVAECTVKHHLASVFDKLGVFSRLQLALFAIHHHLVNVAEFLP
jgi:DNA-binding NarL/FixJ family response regulator